MCGTPQKANLPCHKAPKVCKTCAESARKITKSVRKVCGICAGFVRNLRGFLRTRRASILRQLQALQMMRDHLFTKLVERFIHRVQFFDQFGIGADATGEAEVSRFPE